LLEPSRYLDELSAMRDKQIGHWTALAVLLAERGRSPELDAVCAALRDAYADRPLAAEHLNRLIEWAQTYASRR
jgi:hypothetical protein